eukprot:3194634-Prymnesium_polylepis.1
MSVRPRARVTSDRRRHATARAGACGVRPTDGGAAGCRCACASLDLHLTRPTRKASRPRSARSRTLAQSSSAGRCRRRGSPV